MPSIRNTAQRFALGALVFTACACDDGDETALRSLKCDEICAHYEMCDDGTDETGCQDRCKAQSFRSDTYFEIKARCVGDLTCNRLEDQDDSNDLTDCIRREFRDEDSSKDATELCNSLGNTLADCDSADYDEVVDACSPVAITLSDEYLNASQKCADGRCSGVEQCLEDLADDFDTNVKVYSDD